jgi:riboflavin synthase
MFTGIVQHLGEVAAVTGDATGQALQIDTRGWSTQPAIGDSVAVNGCCLTVSARTAGVSTLHFDIVPQTLRTTTLGSLAVGDMVNLEPAVTAATLMSGHIVQGHVDGVAVVRSVSTDDAEHRLRIEPSSALAQFIVDKGSIAVDGVSLTVAAKSNAWFEVALIPTTLDMTNLAALREGGQVNLEVDYIAKIVVSWLQRGQTPLPAAGKGVCPH